MGELPVDWSLKPLVSVGEVLNGLTYAPSDVSGHGTLVLRSSNIQNDTLSFRDNVLVEMDIPERILVKPNDVLICVRNGSRALIGKTALLDERVTGMTFGAFMAVFRSPYGCFINCLFRSSLMKRQIDQHLGATINQITNGSLKSFLVPMPSGEPEIRAIECALSDVDALLERLYAEFNLSSLLVEGGATVLNDFLKQDAWNEIKCWRSPAATGGGLPAPSIPDHSLPLPHGLASSGQLGVDAWTNRLHSRHASD